MKRKELVIAVSTIEAAKKHTCDYCGAHITKGSQYHKIETRIAKVERFGIYLKVCFKHEIGLLPLSLLWKRDK